MLSIMRMPHMHGSNDRNVVKRTFEMQHAPKSSWESQNLICVMPRLCHSFPTPHAGGGWGKSSNGNAGRSTQRARYVWAAGIQCEPFLFRNRWSECANGFRRTSLWSTPLALLRADDRGRFAEGRGRMPPIRTGGVQYGQNDGPSKRSLSGLRLHKIVCSNGAICLVSNELHSLLAGPDVALAVSTDHLRGHADVCGEGPLLALCLFEPLGELHDGLYSTTINIVQP